MDGVNWFRCECAPGFAGPDCRISEWGGSEVKGHVWKGTDEEALTSALC